MPTTPKETPTAQKKAAATPKKAASTEKPTNAKTADEKSDIKKPPQVKKKRKLLIFLIILLVLILILLTFFSVVAYAVYGVIKEAPAIQTEDIYSLLNENSFLYDDKGEFIERLQSAELRTNIKYEDIPDCLINAFIALEDKTFWQHSGFNYVRIIGAVWDNISTGDRIAGTSTITQQLARNLYLTDIKSERTLSRKITEAYYTYIIEQELTKKDIMEAYLNTIYFGFSASGVEAASLAYFDKHAKELTIAESAVLASITKNPSKFAPIKRLPTSDVDSEDPDIIDIGTPYTLLYNGAFKDRQEFTLSNMYQEGYITFSEYEEAMDEDIQLSLKPTINEGPEYSSYFSDFVIDQVAEDLAHSLKIEEKDAYYMLYNKGLSIYSTLNVEMQKILEEECEKEENLPDIRYARKDKYGNITTDTGRVTLFKYENLITNTGDFVMSNSNMTMHENGNMTLFKGSLLNFVSDSTGDIKVYIKNMYKQQGRTYYIFSKTLVNIPIEAKFFDSDNNLVIGAEFLAKNPDFFHLGTNSLIVNAEHVLFNDSVIQPQVAAVTLDYSNGHIKAMVGGRNIEGKLMFNRAVAPHPPGSSIKPIGVYAPALLQGYGPSTTLVDSENKYRGKVWPKNWYKEFRGKVSLRSAIEQSMNVPAVRVAIAISHEASIDILKRFGVTTIVEEGESNDINPAALALGGMTVGISPLEMAAAYGTMANGGKYERPVTYTEVVNKAGDTLLASVLGSRQVLDDANAYLMVDMLRTTVSRGIAGRAKLKGEAAKIPVAGKTGTTSNNYDAWFIGFTPYFSTAVWVGNDVNMQLSEGSTVAASLWSKIMTKLHNNLPSKDFVRPSTVVRAYGDLYISGKAPKSHPFASLEKELKEKEEKEEKEATPVPVPTPTPPVVIEPTVPEAPTIPNPEVIEPGVDDPVGTGSSP